MTVASFPRRAAQCKAAAIDMEYFAASPSCGGTDQFDVGALGNQSIRRRCGRRCRVQRRSKVQREDINVRPSSTRI